MRGKRCAGLCSCGTPLGYIVCRGEYPGWRSSATPVELTLGYGVKLRCSNEIRPSDVHLRELESKLTQSQADSEKLMEAVVAGVLGGA